MSGCSANTDDAVSDNADAARATFVFLLYIMISQPNDPSDECARGKKKKLLGNVRNCGRVIAKSKCNMSTVEDFMKFEWV